MINPLQKQILAILFAGGDAVEISRVAQAVETEPEMVVKWVPKLREALQESGMPFELLELDGKLQLCTAPEYAPVIQKALELRRNQPLSQAALEVLAIVAYNQPVTRSFVEQIRGGDSSGRDALMPIKQRQIFCGVSGWKTLGSSRNCRLLKIRQKKLLWKPQIWRNRHDMGPAGTGPFGWAVGGALAGGSPLAQCKPSPYYSALAVFEGTGIPAA